jgi:DNA-binding XRE family transcriptional regulator
MAQGKSAARFKKIDFIRGEDFVAKLPAAERAAIDARAAELIAEHLTLRDLRKARDLTQERMAALLGVAQENISRLEQRSDMLLSTLTSYVQAMGGDLKLVVAFPDRKPVELARLADVFARDATAKLRRVKPPRPPGR